MLEPDQGPCPVNFRLSAANGLTPKSVCKYVVDDYLVYRYLQRFVASIERGDVYPFF